MIIVTWNNDIRVRLAINTTFLTNKISLIRNSINEEGPRESIKVVRM